MTFLEKTFRKYLEGLKLLNLYLINCNVNKTETGKKERLKQLKKIKSDNQSDVRIEHC